MVEGEPPAPPALISRPGPTLGVIRRSVQGGDPGQSGMHIPGSSGSCV